MLNRTKPILNHEDYKQIKHDLINKNIEDLSQIIKGVISDDDSRKMAIIALHQCLSYCNQGIVMDELKILCEIEIK